MTLTPSNGWTKLALHRQQAATHPLAILVWGPSDDGSSEYLCRCKIRDRLRAAGHDARFSEDLARHPTALRDPIDDETLQAESADVIIVLYGSRGTQTEHDVILANSEIASKAIIAIERRLKKTLVTRALASEAWRKTSKHARIIVYNEKQLPDLVVDEIIAMTQEIRQAVYVRGLRLGGLG